MSGGSRFPAANKAKCMAPETSLGSRSLRNKDAGELRIKGIRKFSSQGCVPVRANKARVFSSSVGGVDTLSGDALDTAFGSGRVLASCVPGYIRDVAFRSKHSQPARK
ncbi:hypothetical protein ZHAS_00004352 [Anopheles sinensis]|uniref:Uncharacterized protein n=1 Tax=Anopheles sinensis TaxID=74873 RepID=A0A084VGQ2_ANOSI|nr:hypothetical protein ZHAS_00004352 [Anopheles sinensis]